MIYLALIAGLDSFLLVPNGVPVAHQACISQAHVVTDLTFEFVVRGRSLLVLLLGDHIMGQGLLVLAQVVVALPAAHVEQRQPTFILDTVLVCCLATALASCFIENGRTEIIQSSLIVVHHHVALATFVVGHSKVY